MAISWLGSDFTGRDVEDWEAVETLRRVVDVETAFESFFL
jgi:hypothetical protein